MSLPANWSVAEARVGPYRGSDGEILQGQVEFSPRPNRLVDDDGTMIVRRKTIAELDSNGEGTVDLPVNNDPNVTPSGWTWHVKERFLGGGGDSYDITVTTADVASGFDLSDRAPEPTVAFGDFRNVFRSELRAEMDAVLAEAEAARDLAIDISGIDTSDEAIDVALQLPGGLAAGRLAETYARAPGSNLARFINRARAGQAVKVVAIGDSILEGTTVSADGGVLGVDDTLSRVATLVNTRFGNTVTTANHALSGHTAAMGPLSLKWNAAVAEAADLYLVDYGTNDWSANDYASPVPGYRTAASVAALERLFRRLRTDVPKADIGFLIANPYSSSDSASNNVGKKAYNKAVADVCAAYGVEVIDGYAAFMERSDRASLMADSTHPNSAGHAVLAAEVMEHLPATFRGPSTSLAPVPTKGLRRPEEVDLTLGDTGAEYVLVPTASTWVETGTWAADGANRVTSTAGSSFTCTANAVEFYAMLSTAAADNAVVTIKRDGTTVYSNVNLTLGKQGTYWVPLITTADNLTPLGGNHTLEVVLVSGTLRVSRVGWLRGNVPAYNSDQNWQSVAQGSSSLAIASSGTTFLTPSSASTRITWPTGWGSAKVRFGGYVNIRTTGATTTPRRAQVLVRLNGVVVDIHQAEVLASTAAIYLPPVTISSAAADINANRLVSVEVSMVSTDKTLCEVISWDVQAHLIRLT